MLHKDVTMLYTDVTVLHTDVKVLPCYSLPVHTCSETLHYSVTLHVCTYIQITAHKTVFILATKIPMNKRH